MAYYALWAGAIVVMVLACWSLFSQVKSLLAVTKFQRHYHADHNDSNAEQGSILSIVIYMAGFALGIYLATQEGNIPGAVLFVGVALAFLALAIKTWLKNRLIISKGGFAWMDSCAKFRDIKKIEPGNHMYSISLKNGKSLDVPTSIGMSLQAHKVAGN